MNNKNLFYNIPISFAETLRKYLLNVVSVEVILKANSRVHHAGSQSQISGNAACALSEKFYFQTIAG